MTTHYAISRSTNTLERMAGIGSFIKEKRGTTTQKALAELSGVDRAYLAQIENGRIALPGADIRRRIAAALGVSHLDMLLAAGEITEEEIVRAGATSQAHDDPYEARLIEVIRRIRWDERTAPLVEGMLNQMFSVEGGK